MSADMPDRSDKADDLVHAYAQAHALADGGGPAAAVRANVLAAARAVAAEAAGRVAAETAASLPLAPVAPPVADVGRGRARAINLSSWRVRSGAALAAMLLVGLAGWRFDAARRLDNGEQVAMAELRMAAAPTAQVPHELPVPPLSGASYPYVPPPVVDDPADSARTPAAKVAPRDKEVIVAQLDQPAERSARAAMPPAAVAPARRPQPAAAPSLANADMAEPAPGLLASSGSQAKAIATQQEPTLVTIKAAPTQIATAPAMPPSVLQRRVPVIPAAPPPPAAFAKAAPQPDTVVAAAESNPQRAEVDASRPAFSGAGAGAGDAVKKSAPAVAGSLVTASARLLPSPLHAAADRGDVEALKQALANPSTPVDAPDASGRTALLHAVLAQQAGAVRLLLAAGADPARADQAGLTPRAAAQTGANAEIAALLATPR